MLLIRQDAARAGTRTTEQQWRSLVVRMCFACIALTQACAGTLPSCKVPNAVELEIETSDRLNADGDGRSLPVVVRLYQLKDLSRLQSAEFDDVWQHSNETLNGTLVSFEELTAYPGQVVVRHFERDDKADFLVGIAIFRNPVGSTWRAISEFPLPGDACQERNDENAAPKLTDLRVRMFLEEYRIEAVDNYAALAKRSCGGKAECVQTSAPNELPEELRHRRLRGFEEDPSRPKPTVSESQ